MLFKNWRNIWRSPYTPEVYTKICNRIGVLKIKSEQEAIAQLRKYYHVDAIKNVFKAIIEGDIFDEQWNTKFPQAYPSPTWQDWLTVELSYLAQNAFSILFYPIGFYLIS